MQYRRKKVTVRFTDQEHEKYNGLIGLKSLCWNWTELTRKALQLYYDQLTPTPLEVAAKKTRGRKKGVKS